MIDYYSQLLDFNIPYNNSGHTKIDENYITN
jgi:hypothetical protein